MTKRKVAIVAVVAMLTTLGASGCVTKKLFRKNVEETDTRIQGVESGVEENERRIQDMRQETDGKIAAVRDTADRAVELGTEAQAQASTAHQLAERAARGKLLWEITLSDDSVKFSFDQAELPDMASTRLNELVAQIKAYDKAVYMEIEGHTDNIGSAEYNQQLSERRADAVRRYLNSNGGIPLHAMSVVGYGETNPVADNSTVEGRSQNRRVVIRVLE